MACGSYKQTLLCVLSILMDRSDASHRLSQKEIARLVNELHDLGITRDCVKRNITELIDNGYPIIREKGGWYFNHVLSSSDLDLIIACLQSYGGLSCAQRDGLIERLLRLGGSWYHPVSLYEPPKPTNPHFPYVLDHIHEAIRRNRKISFSYADYGTDKAFHPRMDKVKTDEIKKYTVSPYAIFTENSRYYLICNINKYNSLTHFRVDRIINCAITSKSLKDPSKVRGMEDFNITKYVSEHPFMFSGEVHTFRVRILTIAINDVLDWFGMKTAFENETETEVDAIIRSEPTSLRLWALRYRNEIIRIHEKTPEGIYIPFIVHAPDLS